MIENQLFDPQAADPFAKAIPGQSLTDTPGQWPFERPPQIVDPEQAFNVVVQSLEQPESQDDVINLLDIGISAETIASSITLKMFSEGIFTPDVAEIIKPSVVAVIADMGAEAGVEDINVINTLPKQGIPVEERMEMMSKINPDKFNRMASQALEEEELEEALLGRASRRANGRTKTKLSRYGGKFK